MLSIIVNFFNMRREACNTLHSLTRAYQLGAEGVEYEVVAVDNNSTSPISQDFVRSFGSEFRYLFHATHSQSPAQAINAASRAAAGDHLLILIDRAHIVTPGVLSLAERCFRLFDHPFAATVALHLGPKAQNHSIGEGYDPIVEEQLLQQCRWKANGYRLFGASRALADESGGWFGCLYESNCFAIRKDDFLALGGFDERFQSRGGGIVNLDFFRQALLNQYLHYVMLLGEATFHQVHGGVASNAPPPAPLG